VTVIRGGVDDLERVGIGADPFQGLRSRSTIASTS
jgi:hypothetical protein